MTHITASSRQRTARGRTSAEVLMRLRKELLSGKYHAGQFIPTQRQLAETFQVAPDTVRRALKALVAEGLLVAKARQGFCVQARANDPRDGCPLAFLDDWQVVPVQQWGSIDRDILSSLRTAASERGWPLLALSIKNRPLSQVKERLEAARAFGVVLSTAQASTVQRLRALPFPLIMLEQCVFDPQIDSIMQDDFQGGVQAAQYLLERGCRRIAWIGRVRDEVHCMARLGGAVAALLAAGRSLSPDLLFATPTDTAAPAAVQAMLAGKARPDGVIALWSGLTHAVHAGAQQAGLRVGRDLHLVGWSPDELYESSYVPGFAGGPVAPAIAWNIRTMAQTTVARMAERRTNPTLPTLQMKVPVRLRLGLSA